MIMRQDWFDIEFSHLPILQLGDDFEQKILSPLSYFKEHQSKWVLEFDLPLVDKKDINIHIVSDEMIVVEAKLREIYYDSKTSKRYEYEYFKKTVSLPKNIDIQNISARFTRGRLVIILPKLSQGTKINVED
jgi:HSP20 family protein